VLGQPVERTSSKYADEGTFAHYIAAECLKQGKDARAALAAKGVVEDGEVRLLNVGEEAKDAFVCNVEMCDFIQQYLDLVRSFGGDLLVEQSLPIGGLTGEKEAFGTADAVILLETEMVVVDLKFGRGVEVDAVDNPQLMIYALAAYEQYGLMSDFKTVRVVISQPRCTSVPSEFVMPVGDLLAFGDTVAEKAAECLMLVGKPPADLTPYLSPSEKACQWCRAKAGCPALTNFVTQTVAGVSADEIAAITDDFVKSKTYLAVDSTTLSAKMRATPLIQMWCESVMGEGERRLMAGEEVPGYKVVQGRKGSRAWTDADEAEKVLKSMRLKVDEMYDFKLISPTSAEKVLKETPKRWARVLPLIGQAEGKLSVAKASDKRPAVAVGVSQDELSALQAEEPLA
jgi:hypothetical protein